MEGRAAIIFGGAPVQAVPRLRTRLAALDRPFVVAADSGAETALEFGCVPAVLLGDFDSIRPDVLAELTRRGVAIESYSRDKDDTDGGLAVQRALAVAPTEVLLVGYLGGPRLDHGLANVFHLAAMPPGATLLDELNECFLLRGGEERNWTVEAGELISLVPMSAEATGVRTMGLRWALAGDTLPLGTTRGVANEPTAERVSVTFEQGLLLVTRHFPG